MKDFKFFMDTNYYKDIEKYENCNCDYYLILVTKVNSDITEVICNIGKILNIKTKLVLEYFEKINPTGILTEEDALICKCAI